MAREKPVALSVCGLSKIRKLTLFSACLLIIYSFHARGITKPPKLPIDRPGSWLDPELNSQQQPRQVIVLRRDEVSLRALGSQSVVELLGKMIPGMSPGSQSFTDKGLTLRGRKMEVLLNGVSLRTGREIYRTLSTISADAIESIEVVRGANASGVHTADGVVKITTRQHESLVTSSRLGIASPIRDVNSGSMSPSFFQTLSYAGEQSKVSGFVGGLKQKSWTDSYSLRISPDQAYGDRMDSQQLDLGLNLEKQFQGQRSLSFSGFLSRTSQQSDYGWDKSVSQLPPPIPQAADIRPQAVKGLILDKQNDVEQLLLTLKYQSGLREKDQLETQIFYRDFQSRGYPSQQPSDTGRQVQAELDSSSFGGFFKLNHHLANGLAVAWGGGFDAEMSKETAWLYDPDLAKELNYQLVGKGRYTQDQQILNMYIYSQLSYKLASNWLLEGGVKYDYSEVKWDGFNSVSRVSNPFVPDGKVDPSAVLFNAGVVYDIENHELYSGFSQASEMPDYGLMLATGTAGGALPGEPKLIDKVEMGWRAHWPLGRAEFAAFYSQGKDATTRDRIYGVELVLGAKLHKQWFVNTSFSWMEGKSKLLSGGSYRAMDGWLIPPLKVTAFFTYVAGRTSHHHLQFVYIGDADSRLDGIDAPGRHEVESSMTVDYMLQFNIGPGSLDLGVENLFNRNYFPTYSQLLPDNTVSSYYPARGTSVKLAYSIFW